MPKVKCPYQNCDYETDDVSDAIVVSLLNIHAKSHAAPDAPRQATTAAKVEKVRCPTVTSAGTSEEWAYFITRWKEYATATKVTGNDRVIQLLECCDEPLQKDLTRAAGGSLTEKSEDQVLAAMKTVAVREENAMVARVALHDMRQERDETVRSFGARIRGQAGVCKFSVECPQCHTKVNYTDSILRDVLSRGLADHEIQLDLLGDANQDMTLEEVFQFVESKEAGKRSALRLHESQGAQAASSSYKQSKRPPTKERQQNSPELCNYCGQQGHGVKAPPRIRRDQCQAYNHTCKHCGRLHHFEQLCRSKDNHKPKQQRRSQPSYRPGSPRDHPASDECEGAVFDTLCTMTASGSYHHQRAITLDHHLYNHLHDSWVRQASKPQPFIPVMAMLCPEDYTALGLKVTPSARSTKLNVMADTGCQSCLAGIKAINRLGLSHKDLIPVSMKMHTASNAGINIIGAVILRFSGKAKSGQEFTTRQLVYITDSSDKVFLSREACADLHMISPDFPTVGDTLQDQVNPPHSQADATHATDTPGIGPSSSVTLAPCGCPKRQQPPPLPTSLPFPATEENRERLQQWLIDYTGPAPSICVNISHLL